MPALATTMSQLLFGELLMAALKRRSWSSHNVTLHLMNCTWLTFDDDALAMEACFYAAANESHTLHIAR